MPSGKDHDHMASRSSRPADCEAPVFGKDRSVVDDDSDLLRASADSQLEMFLVCSTVDHRGLLNGVCCYFLPLARFMEQGPKKVRF